MDHKRSLFVSLAVAIVGFGIVMVYSASITSWPTEFERIYLSRQLAALGVGRASGGRRAPRFPVVLATCGARLLVVTIVLLAAVLLPGVGTRVNGARRWLRHGGFQFQPSELAKLALTLYLCRQAARAKPQSNSSKVQSSRSRVRCGSRFPLWDFGSWTLVLSWCRSP